MKIPFNLLCFRYTWLRPLISMPLFALVFYLAPVLNWFRVDMITLRLVYAGQAYPFSFDTVKWLPIGFYAGVVVVGIVSWFWGRLFCGWVCPHNTMTEWTRPLRAAFKIEPEPLYLKRFFQQYPMAQKAWPGLAVILSLGLTTFLSMMLSFYIVPPQWVLAQYASGHPHVALVFGHGLITLIGLYLLLSGHHFCRNACPYGMAQSMSAYQEGKRRPMEIHFQGQSIAQDCGTCQACQTVCPVDVDPRKTENLIVGQFFGCFNCGACIDACKVVHQKHDYQGLLVFEQAFHPKQPAC